MLLSAYQTDFLKNSYYFFAEPAFTREGNPGLGQKELSNIGRFLMAPDGRHAKPAESNIVYVETIS